MKIRIDKRNMVALLDAMLIKSAIQEAEIEALGGDIDWRMDMEEMTMQSVSGTVSELQQKNEAQAAEMAAMREEIERLKARIFLPGEELCSVSNAYLEGVLAERRSSGWPELTGSGYRLDLVEIVAKFQHHRSLDTLVQEVYELGRAVATEAERERKAEVPQKVWLVLTYPGGHQAHDIFRELEYARGFAKDFSGVLYEKTVRNEKIGDRSAYLSGGDGKEVVPAT